MPITDIASYVTTGQEIDSHFADVNTDRVANMLPEFTLPDGYAKADLVADVAAAEAAITLEESLNNALSIAINGRDSQKEALRQRMVDFRKLIGYKLKDSVYGTSLKPTPHKDASEQKMLRAMDDMADLWTRINADTSTPNFTPPLVYADGFALAAFQTAVAALRTQYKAVVDAENDARIARKQRDILLARLRDRMVEYRQGIEVEYGEQHPFTLSLPDVYPPNGGGPPTLPAARYKTEIVGSDTQVTIEVPAGLVDIQTLKLVHGGTPFFTAFSPMPGTTVQTTWPGVTISGAIDEVKIQNGASEDIAVGEFDPMVPDP